MIFLYASMHVLLLVCVQIYRVFIRPLGLSACLMQPSCSQYAYEAITKFGPFYGAYLSFLRVLRCHPGQTNYYDPVP